MRRGEPQITIQQWKEIDKLILEILGKEKEEE